MTYWVSRFSCLVAGHDWTSAGGRLEVCTRLACRGDLRASRWTR